MNYDFAPLFRTAIGFDRLAGLAREAASAPAYPPYNIEKLGDDRYRLSMAVAGFSEDDLDISVENNALRIAGRVNPEQGDSELLYRGIAGRAFERRFALAEHIVVEDAELRNGLLHVGLKRVVPEALKPRQIAIGAARAVPSAMEAPRPSNDTARAGTQPGAHAA